MPESTECDKTADGPQEANAVSQENGKLGKGNPLKKPKKPKHSQETQSTKRCTIAPPYETLIKFALSAQRLVTPRMNVEKELVGQPDLIPSDPEMLLSIAKLITKLNLCSIEMNDENVLTCVRCIPIIFLNLSRYSVAYITSINTQLVNTGATWAPTFTSFMVLSLIGILF